MTQFLINFYSSDNLFDFDFTIIFQLVLLLSLIFATDKFFLSPTKRILNKRKLFYNLIRKRSALAILNASKEFCNYFLLIANETKEEQRQLLRTNVIIKNETEFLFKKVETNSNKQFIRMFSTILIKKFIVIVNTIFREPYLRS